MASEEPPYQSPEGAEPEGAEPASSELEQRVRSQIVQQILAELQVGRDRASATLYTKSDGKNYGMYQKADEMLRADEMLEILERRGEIQRGSN